RGRLQVVEPRARLRGGIPAVPGDPGGHHTAAAARSQEGAGMSGARGAGQGRLQVLLVNGALLVLASASLAPLLWMLSVSFMPMGEASRFPPPLLPESPTL